MMDGDLAGPLLDLLADTDDVAELLDELVHLAVANVPRATSATVTMMGGRGPITAARTDDHAAHFDQFQYARDDGPCLAATRLGEIQQIGAVSEDLGPDWAEIARTTGVQAVLCLPLMSAPELTGSLNLYASEPQTPSWPGDSFVRADMLAAYAADAIAVAQRVHDLNRHNRRLIAEFERTRVVNLAVGVIMARRGCGPDRAHALLSDMAETKGATPYGSALQLISAIAAHGPG